MSVQEASDNGSGARVMLYCSSPRGNNNYIRVMLCIHHLTYYYYEVRMVLKFCVSISPDNHYYANYLVRVRVRLYSLPIPNEHQRSAIAALGFKFQLFQACSEIIESLTYLFIHYGL